MGDTLHVEKNSVIFEEGKWEMVMYGIISGKVAIYSAYGTDNEKLLAELEAGRYFGEMGLIEAMPRSATAIATEDTVLKVITQDNFREYFNDSPDEVLSIMKGLTGRLRELSKQYLDACYTISDYLQSEEDKKPKKAGLLDKIARLIAESEQYVDEYDIQMWRYTSIDQSNYWF